jgi:hypothetical protein
MATNDRVFKILQQFLRELAELSEEHECFISLRNDGAITVKISDGGGWSYVDVPIPSLDYSQEVGYDEALRWSDPESRDYTESFVTWGHEED